MIIMIDKAEALEWLERALARHAGSGTKLAREIGADPKAISKMRYGDAPISGKVAKYFNIKKVHGEDRYVYTIPDDQRY